MHLSTLIVCETHRLADFPIHVITRVPHGAVAMSRALRDTGEYEKHMGSETDLWLLCVGLDPLYEYWDRIKEEPPFT